MSNEPPERTLPKLQQIELPVLLGQLKLRQEAAAAADGCNSVTDLLAALESGEFDLEAMRLFAFALPKREAVWWACMCARHTTPAQVSAVDLAALEAAEIWVRLQTDKSRRAAMDHAQKSGFGSPEAWAAVAAFWSGNSLSPHDQPKVPPAQHLTGTAVAGAVQLASVRGDPARQRARLNAFLSSAHEIAAGGAGRLQPEKP